MWVKQPEPTATSLKGNMHTVMHTVMHTYTHTLIQTHLCTNSQTLGFTKNVLYVVSMHYMRCTRYMHYVKDSHNRQIPSEVENIMDS